MNRSSSTLNTAISTNGKNSKPAKSLNFPVNKEGAANFRKWSLNTKTPIPNKLSGWLKARKLIRSDFLGYPSCSHKHSTIPSCIDQACLTQQPIPPIETELLPEARLLVGVKLQLNNRQGLSLPVNPHLYRKGAVRCTQPPYLCKITLPFSRGRVGDGVFPAPSPSSLASSRL